LALGEETNMTQRNEAVSAVMIIPIPKAGIFELVDRIAEALATVVVQGLRPAHQQLHFALSPALRVV
jgi:hypothetical protein